MKKSLIIRTIAFVLIFCVLFLVVQSVLHHRWLHSNNLYERLTDYEAATDEDVDVIAFGTSEVLASFLPIEMYREAGITGCNMAISWKSAVTQYYQLKYVLKKHTPKVVMCDFSCLYSDCLPADNLNVYSKVIDTMPDREIKEELIREVIHLDNEQDYFVLKYPLFRYHNMWTDLKAENFEKERYYNEKYKSYRNGAQLNDETFTGGLIEVNEDLWNSDGEVNEFSQISIEYYDKFIKECQDRGIKVVAYIPPKLNYASRDTRNLANKMEYFNSRNVECLNYNNYDSFLRADLDLEIDYFDIEHLNAPGAVKLSRLIAKDLKEILELEDRRNDSKVSEKWNGYWDEFVNDMVRLQSSPYSQIDMVNSLGLKSKVSIADGNVLEGVSFRELRDFANENPGNQYIIDVTDEDGKILYTSVWKYEEDGWVDSNSSELDEEEGASDFQDEADED